MAAERVRWSSPWPTGLDQLVGSIGRDNVPETWWLRGLLSKGPEAEVECVAPKAGVANWSRHDMSETDQELARSQGVGADAAGMRLWEVSNCSESHL